MRRVMLTIEYDGARFFGWQLQAEGRTVQGAVEDAVRRATTAFSRVTGASRTDSGVHALGQAAHFDTETALDDATLLKAINAWLPDDVAVLDCRTVPADFHVQFAPSTKLYRYRILCSRVPRPLREPRVLRVWQDLDADTMRRAAAALLGEHDFTSFCSEHSEAESKIRTIVRSDIVRQGDELHYLVRGQGFLYNMVRIIVGTLVQVGKGNMTPAEFAAALRARDRKAAFETAPPQGLTLVRIDYESDPRCSSPPFSDPGAGS